MDEFDKLVCAKCGKVLGYEEFENIGERNNVHCLRCGKKLVREMYEILGRM